MSAPISREAASDSPSTRTTMRWLSTKSTVPERRATMHAPESRAVMYSMPVPTYGARARSSGTAWRCMFDPISARFASSFSRNGMSEAATAASARTGLACLVLVGADVVGLDDVADLVLRIAAGVGDDDVVDDAAVL